MFAFGYGSQAMRNRSKVSLANRISVVELQQTQRKIWPQSIDMKKAPEVGVLHTVRALCYPERSRFPLDVNHLGTAVQKIRCRMLRSTAALLCSSRST